MKICSMLMKQRGETIKAFTNWLSHAVPPELGKGKWSVPDASQRLREKLAATQDVAERTKVELVALDWLHELTRANIKRGRVFELDEVLTQGHADCLGYARVIGMLGTWFGLDIGVVDIVIDNAGRYVPHSTNLLTLSDKRLQLVDLWYGSKNINHRRVGVQVKEQGTWRVEDIEWPERDRWEEVRPLPLGCVEAITWYIRGNRHLGRGIGHAEERELDEAIECYDAAIKLYPTNARLHFNRAVAYENKGDRARAARDYAQALRDESSQVRVFAREHEEIVQLIELDRLGIGSREQEMYLLRKGFISGEETALKEIAERYGDSENQIEQTISRIEARLGSQPLISPSP